MRGLWRKCKSIWEEFSEKDEQASARRSGESGLCLWTASDEADDISDRASCCVFPHHLGRRPGTPARFQQFPNNFFQINTVDLLDIVVGLNRECLDLKLAHELLKVAENDFGDLTRNLLPFKRTEERVRVERPSRSSESRSLDVRPPPRNNPEEEEAGDYQRAGKHGLFLLTGCYPTSRQPVNGRRSPLNLPAPPCILHPIRLVGPVS